MSGAVEGFIGESMKIRFTRFFLYDENLDSANCCIERCESLKLYLSPFVSRGKEREKGFIC